MESNFKLVMGAAVVGIFLGIAGLVFGILSKNQADELRTDFLQVHGLFEKVSQVEESSSGLSANAARIKREVDALRSGTQGALDQVSEELTRLRRDLNNSIAQARGLEERIAELSRPPAPTALAPVADRPSDAGQSASAAATVENGGPAEEEQFYVIRGGDTLSRVAANHGVSLTSLTEANPGIDPLRLQVGQRIRLPAR